MDNETHPRRFDFDRDRFAFANELVWEYQLDPATGKMNFRPHDPKPEYTHRCFVLARAARQFLYHARFDPAQKPVDVGTYRQLVHGVLARSPRVPSPAKTQIIIPGYPSLCEFSASQAKLLKAVCGGAWRSYVLRSHWRMALPISRKHQARTAAGLLKALARTISPIVHLVKFPSLTINHGMLIFASSETASGHEFLAFDPNNTAQPARLTYDRVRRTFFLPANRYWAGGELNIIQIYRTWWM